MRPAWLISLLSLTLCTLVFYLWQNHIAHHGGSVSAVKAAWLGLTVFFWLVWPLLVLADARTERPLRQAYALFWLLMLIRAVVEAWLLATDGWQYRYGIGHDVFSMVLLLLAWQYTRHQTPTVLRHTLAVMAAMFAAETYFARYIARFNHGHDHAALWFIDWQPPHLTNQIITTILVIGLIGWLIHLHRQWARS